MKGLVCVILAAGEGKRMKSAYGKVSHALAGRPIISYVLEAARTLAPEKTAVVIGYDAERVQKAAGEGVEFILQEEQRGTGHAVIQARPFFEGFEGDLLLLSGDVPLITSKTLQMLLDAHRVAGAACTLLTALLKNPTGYGRVIRRANGKPCRIVEEKDADRFQKAVEEINSGIYLFDAPSLLGVLDLISSENRQREFYITDAVELLAAAGKTIEAICAEEPGEILGINSREELAKMEKLLQQRIQKAHMLNGVTIVDPATTYIEGTVEIGRDTIIYPFSVLSGPARIGIDCRVGPFSHVRQGTIIEDGAEVGNFVEVKSSTIGGGTKARHLSYIGDTVIGKRANIGAGTITANFDGIRKHRTEIGDDAFIGSGTTLVAPVRVGAGAVTGAGAVVLRGRNVPDGGVVVGVPAAPMRKKGEKKHSKTSDRRRCTRNVKDGCRKQLEQW